MILKLHLDQSCRSSPSACSAPDQGDGGSRGTKGNPGPAGGPGGRVSGTDVSDGLSSELDSVSFFPCRDGQACREQLESLEILEILDME